MQGETARPAPVPPEPLSDAEMAPLWRRERQVGWLQIAAMGSLLLTGFAVQRIGIWAANPLLLGAFVLLATATVLQVRLRCPRCKGGLRGKLMRILPDKCPGCGIELPRQG